MIPNRFLMAAIVGSLAMFASPIKAQTIPSQGLEFSEDTAIEFAFVESHGANQSTFGVINLSNGEKTPLFTEATPSDQPEGVRKPTTNRDDTGTPRDFLGSANVRTIQSEYLFRAGTPYAFYLDSTYNGRTLPTVYSTQFEANGDEFSTRREGGLDAGTVSDRTGLRISWNDTNVPGAKAADVDYDDFVVEAGGFLVRTLCPPVR